MGYFTRRLGGDTAGSSLFRQPLNPLTQNDLADQLVVDYRGYREFFGFSGNTGSVFMATIREIDANTPYPLRIAYRNDMARPVNLFIDIEHSDSELELLVDGKRIPPFGSWHQVFVGDEAIQSGDAGGTERIRVTARPPFRGIPQDIFFRQVSVNPPPDASNLLVGGNVGGAAAGNRDQATGAFPRPPSLGGFPVWTTDSIWREIQTTFEGIFELFGVRKVDSFEELTDDVNFIISDGSLDLSELKQNVSQSYPGRGAGYLFTLPPEGGYLMAFPSAVPEEGEEEGEEEGDGDVRGTDWPVFMVLEATSQSQAELLLGTFGEQFRLTAQDPQWTFMKTAFVQ